MATRTSVNQSRIPVGHPKEGPTAKTRARTRHLSLMEANSRRGSLSGVSEAVKPKPRTFSVLTDGTGKDVMKPKPRTYSLIADGKTKVRPRVPVRTTSLANILADEDVKEQVVAARRNSISSRRNSLTSRRNSLTSRRNSVNSKKTEQGHKENVPPSKPNFKSKVPVLVPVHKPRVEPRTLHKTLPNNVELLAARLSELVVPLPEGVINIDIEDGLYDYAADVIVYLREREMIYQLPSNFLRGGSTTPDMRAMLVDWLVQVQHYLKMTQETFYLTIMMLDTVLSKRDINSDKLQLVGIACLFMASKLEEYYPADIGKLISLTSDSYTRKQVLRMELVILELLEQQLYFPEIMPFLKRYSRAALRGQDEKFIETCQYLIDSSVTDQCFSTTLPSQRAAASVLASSLLFSVLVNEEGPTDDEVWSITLRHYTKYHISDLVEIALNMFKSFYGRKYEGALKKYESNSMHQRLAKSDHVSLENVKLAVNWVKARIEKL